MEDDDIDTSSGGNLLSVALAVLAIALGAAGLYFGMTANQRLTPLADSMEAGSSSAARLEKDIEGLETRLVELSAVDSEMEDTLNGIRLVGDRNKRAIGQLASGIKKNREEIVKLADRLNELLSSRASSSEPETAGTQNNRQGIAEAAPAAEAAVDAAVTGTTYAIEAGDTLNKVAGDLGVDLQALLDANPGVDPRRLRIGQEIKVPNN